VLDGLVRDLLGQPAEELSEIAAQLLPSGAGLAARIYERAVREGRFEPEAFGLSSRSVAAWREAFRFELPEVVSRIEEESDFGAPTIKIALRFEDGLEVECVRIPMARERFTLCVSSQIGCRLACGFCETAKMGLLRNMTAAEIVSQVVVARAVLGWDVRNLVFMGMGEPLDNADNLIQALAVLNDRRGLGFGQQRMTVCTAGHVEGLERLGELGWRRLGISVSLNAAVDAKRDRLMPVNRRWPLAELRDALIAYRPRPTFPYRLSYCLMPGLNDGRDDAQALIDFALPLLPSIVNVIPYNPGTKPLARAPEPEEVDRFIGWIEQGGVPVRRRITKGRSMMAACGQLGNLELRRSKRLTLVSS
jgi:23S rRNA (adenine2503-C2)-methyltransferase